MPPFIIGILHQEIATHYVLTNVLEQVEDDDFDIHLEPRKELDFINRTYVWRCEILTDKPEFGRQLYEAEEIGGLG